jgi:putative DNA primase/helicase
MGEFSIGSAADAALQLGGTREGDCWRAYCPVCDGHGLTISTSHSTGKLLFYCWSSGCSFVEIVKALREHGIDPSDNVTRVEDYFTDEIGNQYLKIDAARRLLQRTESAEGTLVEHYLASRGITIPVPPALRFLRWCPHRSGSAFPAMVAAVVDHAGEVTGYHATFLAPDDAGKYPFRDKTAQRECRGPIRGAAVRLGDAVDGRLLIGEGIETSLAAAQLFDIPAWAALSANGIATIDLMPEIRHVIIAADNDVNGTGHRAATVLYYRLAAEGRRVEIIMPPTSGADFNDVLIDNAECQSVS